jgi:glycosyltransferase
VAYNAEKTLAHALASVADQNNITVEHILIDGGSSDNTLEVAKHYNISKVVSEPDNGIYDAMNKGIGFARGEIVGILNADDFYALDDVLQKIATVFNDPDVDACYGDLQYVDAHDTNKVVRYWRSGSFESGKFYWGWMPPHPNFFVRRSIYDKYGVFNLPGVSCGL